MKLVYGQVEDEDRLHAVVSSELKELGIKVPKAPKPNGPQVSANVFGGCLSRLTRVSVPQDGFVLQIPRFLVMATSIIRRNPKAEGLFRKGGSIQRQKELKQSVENGGDLESANVHDVANLVKQFLRCLSEPLLQPRLYDAFAKAYDLRDAAARRKAIFLLCALSPIEHLHVLRFLMTFFAEIASYKAFNRMDSNSLAIVLMPNLFILPEELDRKDKSKEKMILKQTGLVQFLIDNHEDIGSVGDDVLERARAAFNSLTHSDDDLDGNRETRTKLTAKKKRNSLNGVFYGLRKMVQQNRIPSACNDEVDASDGSLVERTPSQATKRKMAVDRAAAAQCSSAKKRTMMQLRSQKLPPIPMTHLDSPAPVGHEGEVSSSPACFFGRGNEVDARKRKSGRMRFFGKTYMARRNSTSRTPKQNKKPEKQSFSSSKKQTALRHLIKDDGFAEASPTHLSVPQPQQSPRSYRSILFTSGKPGETSPLCQIKTRTMKPDSNLGPDPRPVVPRPQTTFAFGARRKPSSTAAPPPPPPKDAAKKLQASSEAGRFGRLDIVQRAKSFVSDPAAPTPLDRLLASPVRAAVWRPLVKSSLRRGRPNTVHTGLPVPSPFKAPVVVSGMVHYTSDPGPMTVRPAGAEVGLPGCRGEDPGPVLGTAEEGVQKVLVFGGESEEEEEAPRPGSEALFGHCPAGVGTSSVRGAREEARPVDDRTSAAPDLCLPRSDSGVFEPRATTAVSEAMDVDASHPDADSGTVRGAVRKMPSSDSGINDTEDPAEDGRSPATVIFQEMNDAEDPATALAEDGRSPATVSSQEMNDAEDPATALAEDGRSPATVSSQEMNDAEDPAAALVSSQGAAGDPTRWRSAVDVFRGRGHAEEVAAGRPSLLWIMKDKAGSVSAAARLYDEIAAGGQRSLSLRSASPLVRVRAPLNHRRSVSRDAAAAAKPKASGREAKENRPDKDGGAPAAKTAVIKRTALTPCTGSHNVPRRTRSARTSEDGSVRKPPKRLPTTVKPAVARSLRPSDLQRRSTSL